MDPVRTRPIDSDDLAARLARLYPELNAVREAAAEPTYLVGGAVRDLLLGRGRADLDVVVEGDAAAMAARLGATVAEHERFGTAKVVVDGHSLDIAGARSETYPEPGALPVVVPAPSIEVDLARRDFSVNAMAIPLHRGAELIDPHGGCADFEAGLLRILHSRSFVDDPTRALRAARYAARFDFALDAQTEELLRATDLESVSADRRRAELSRLAAEPSAVAGLRLLAEWGLIEPRPGGLGLAEQAERLLASPPWAEVAPREPTLLLAALGTAGEEIALAAASPAQPSEAVALARPHGAEVLVLARALGAEWLDRYVGELRFVSLEIDGGDLIAAGVAEGPALGRGLEAALRAKLDGEVEGAEQELAVALAAAGRR